MVSETSALDQLFCSFVQTYKQAIKHSYKAADFPGSHLASFQATALVPAIITWLHVK